MQMMQEVHLILTDFVATLSDITDEMVKGCVDYVQEILKKLIKKEIVLDGNQMRDTQTVKQAAKLPSFRELQDVNIDCRLRDAVTRHLF